MPLVLVTGPASEPVTLAEFKLHCRVTSSDEDSTLAIYLAAARRLIEEETGRALLPQTWRQTWDCDPPDPILLGRNPVTAITAAAYTALGDGTVTALDADDYRLDADAVPATLRPAYATYWPYTREGPAAFSVTFTAGYASAAAVPAPLRDAVLLLGNHLFDQRVPVVMGAIATELPWTVERLIALFRVERYV